MHVVKRLLGEGRQIPISSLWWRRHLRRNATCWADLDRFPRLCPDEQRKQLGERLLRQIRYFGARADALPEWRKAARIDNPDDLLRIWPDLPVVTKNDLPTRFPAEEIGQRFKVPGQVNCTGGSTGEPVHFFHDTGMLRSITAAVTFSSIRMGWLPGMPTIIVWGSERDVKKATTRRNRALARLRSQFLVDGCRVGGGALALASVRRPNCTCGFPHAAVTKTHDLRGKER